MLRGNSPRLHPVPFFIIHQSDKIPHFVWLLDVVMTAICPFLRGHLQKVKIAPKKYCKRFPKVTELFFCLVCFPHVFTFVGFVPNNLPTPALVFWKKYYYTILFPLRKGQKITGPNSVVKQRRQRVFRLYLLHQQQQLRGTGFLYRGQSQGQGWGRLPLPFPTFV